MPLIDIARALGFSFTSGVNLYATVAILGLTVVAGASVMSGAGGGLYWLPPSVVLAFVAGLANAWVLLVEILR